jgi:hypothetical protein
MSFKELMAKFIDLIKSDAESEDVHYKDVFYVNSEYMPELNLLDWLVSNSAYIIVTSHSGRKYARFRVDRQTNKIWSLKSSGQDKGYNGTLENDLDNTFWGSTTIRKRTSQDPHPQGMRPQKPANNKIEQEINKELNDLWDRREYKGGTPNGYS